MKLIDQSHEILNISNLPLRDIEIAGRTCYKSESRITPTSAERFAKMLISRGHNAMIEFGDITVRFITNRGVTHELVRHRLCSFSQESSRYVRYNGDTEFIKPVWWVENWEEDKACTAWKAAMNEAEKCYKYLLDNGWRPEQAREVLPNSLKTEIVVKANTREWRHILKLRCSAKAHPQMRMLMIPLIYELQERIPVLFDGIIPAGFDGIV